MEAVARPLPMIVVAEMLGVPAADRARFGTWSRQRARLLEPTVSPRDRALAQAASGDFDAYLPRHRRGPTGGAARGHPERSRRRPRTGASA